MEGLVLKVDFWAFRIDSTGFDFLVVMLVVDELEDPYPIGEIGLGNFVFLRRNDKFNQERLAK